MMIRRGAARLTVRSCRVALFRLDRWAGEIYMLAGMPHARRFCARHHFAQAHCVLAACRARASARRPITRDRIDSTFIAGARLFLRWYVRPPAEGLLLRRRTVDEICVREAAADLLECNLWVPAHTQPTNGAVVEPTDVDFHHAWLSTGSWHLDSQLL